MLEWIKKNMRIKNNIWYIGFPAVYMFFAGTLAWIFALRGKWFSNSLLAPPAWLFLTIWLVVFGLLAASMANLLVKLKNPNTLIFLHILNGALCALYSYLFFYVETMPGTLFLCTLMLTLSFFILKFTLDRDKPAALFFLPYIGWLAFLTALLYNLTLFA